MAIDGPAAVATEVDSSATANLHAELATLRSEVEALSVHPAPAALRNNGFEDPQLLGAAGWQFEPTDGATVELDTTQAQSGGKSVHLASRGHVDWAGPVVAIRSAPLEISATRRLAVTAWMRVDPAAPPASVWLVLEGKYKDQPFSHHVAVGGQEEPASVAPLGEAWTPVTLQLDELPTAGITDLRVGVDLRGAGDVWVDSVEVNDMWISDAERDALVATVDCAQADLSAGRLAQVEKFLTTDLPGELSKFAQIETLVPSLSKAMPLALAAVERQQAAVTSSVGEVVDQAEAQAQQTIANVTQTMAQATRYPITPIGAEAATDTPAAGSSTATAVTNPTVLAGAMTRASADVARTQPTLVTTRKATAGTPSVQAPSVASTVAVSVPTATAADERPWWKVWPARSADESAQATQVSQSPRSMPGTRRAAQPAVAVAKANDPETEVVSLPKSAYRRIRDRFRRDSDSDSASIETAAAAGSTAQITTAEPETESGLARRLRLPFWPSGDDEAAADATADDERRFSLFGLGQGDATTSATQTAAVEEEGSRFSRLNPLKLLSRDDDATETAPQVTTEPREGRMASLLKVFRSDTESETIQR
jgi:hypothetical protein